MAIDNSHQQNTNNFPISALLLVLAGILDALDGIVARMTDTCTEFGVQLDSIADVMNFGCAPGVLIYCYGFASSSNSHPTLYVVGIASCFLFAACGALRLARFNVQVGQTDPRYFVGMPITMGAACVASLVLAWPLPPTSVNHQLLIIVATMMIATLMVSTVRFPSTKQKFGRSKTNLIMLCLMLMLFVAGAVNLHARFFSALFAAYIALTLMINLAWRLGWRGVALPDE